ncbi:MAG: tetratricopeptide repeat protein [Treponema sp.]|nr:tetratricopeptide repeat protein [Treponema sp.]
MKKTIVLVNILFTGLFLFSLSSCVTGPSSVSEEELYSIGKAYFDLGKYNEAEVWFQKASRFKKTEAASLYYIGRILFIQQKYDEAAQIFENLLKKDADNLMLLKAAAFSYLASQKFEKAETLYKRVVALSPESKDSGYTYALVLYGLKKYNDALSILKNLNAHAGEDRDALLLLARTEKKLGYPEALDHYSKWLEKGDDPVVLKEFAEVAGGQSLFARAIEALKKIKQSNREAAAGLQKGEIDFLLGKYIMISDPSDTQGLKYIESALAAGYKDETQFNLLLSDSKLSDNQKQSIKALMLKER